MKRSITNCFLDVSLRTIVHAVIFVSDTCECDLVTLWASLKKLTIWFASLCRWVIHWTSSSHWFLRVSRINNVGVFQQICMVYMHISNDMLHHFWTCLRKIIMTKYKNFRISTSVPYNLAPASLQNIAIFTRNHWFFAILWDTWTLNSSEIYIYIMDGTQIFSY